MQDVFTPEKRRTLIIHIWANLPVNLKSFTLSTILSPEMQIELLWLLKFVGFILFLLTVV